MDDDDDDDEYVFDSFLLLEFCNCRASFFLSAIIY